MAELSFHDPRKITRRNNLLPTFGARVEINLAPIASASEKSAIFEVTIAHQLLVLRAGNLNDTYQEMGDKAGYDYSAILNIVESGKTFFGLLNAMKTVWRNNLNLKTKRGLISQPQLYRDRCIAGFEDGLIRTAHYYRAYRDTSALCLAKLDLVLPQRSTCNGKG